MSTTGIRRLSAFILAISIFLGMATLVSAAEIPEPTDKAAITAAQQKAYDEAVTLKIIYDTNIQNCTFSWSNGKYFIKTYKVISGPYTGIVFQPTYPDVTQNTSSANGKPSNPATGNKLTDEQLKEYAKEVYDLVNKEREEAGLNPVVWDREFAACAQIRAQELSRKYSHERPDPVNDGIQWPTNASGIGVYNAPSVADEQDVPHNWIMENIVKGSISPSRAVNTWMDSSGHRKNILKESHTRCGVGVYQSDKGIYWVLWFDDYTNS